MKIEAFERNEQDQVVAVGDKKIVLSWDYVKTHKPQVGDDVIEQDGELVHESVQSELDAIEEAPKKRKSK
jgi:hypothetical protein